MLVWKTYANAKLIDDFHKEKLINTNNPPDDLQNTLDLHKYELSLRLTSLQQQQQISPLQQHYRSTKLKSAQISYRLVMKKIPSSAA